MILILWSPPWYAYEYCYFVFALESVSEYWYYYEKYSLSVFLQILYTLMTNKHKHVVSVKRFIDETIPLHSFAFYYVWITWLTMSAQPEIERRILISKWSTWFSRTYICKRSQTLITAKKNLCYDNFLKFKYFHILSNDKVVFSFREHLIS